MKIAVFGLGYVGAVTAAGLAARGHTVVGVDVDPVKVDSLNGGVPPVVEPGLDAMVADVVQSGALRATADAVEALEACDVSLLCVGTPSAPGGETDLTYLRRALEDILAAMARATPPNGGHHSVVVRSTVPPGTGDTVVAPAMARAPQGWTVGTAMCPEFLREGSSVSDFFSPPMVVLGTADESVRRSIARMFAFLDTDVRHMDVRGAEALKYACNAFHATKVSFANELSQIFRALGVDSREVMEVFCQDHVLNISPAYLRPGFAFGGSCLPKDLRSLLHMARTHSLDTPLLSGTVRTNQLLLEQAVDRVVAADVTTVALLGLSFKSDTDDLRESPNVDLAERLLGKGFDVRIYDQIVNPDRLLGSNLRYVEQRLPHLRRLLCTTPEKALDGAGLAIVSTADQTSLDALRRSAPPQLLDLHGRLGEEIESLPGYQGIGWAL